MPQGRTFLLRRHFSVHQASRRGGWAGTLEFVFDPRGGRGSSWLAEVKAHQFLDVIGPLGKAFAYPAKLSTCLLVAEGHGSAPMHFLGPGAPGPRQARRHAGGCGDAGARLQADRGQAPRAERSSIATEDGSLGETRKELADSAARRSSRATGRTGGSRGGGPADARRNSQLLPIGRPPRRSPWRRKWRAASACASPAPCRSTARTARATTTSERAIDGSGLQPGPDRVGPLDGGAAGHDATPPEGFPVVKTWPG